MHPQLQLVVAEFAAAQERLHRLAAAVPDEWWAVRPAPARWSIGECVAHLDLTAEAYLPLIRRGIAEGRALGRAPAARFCPVTNNATSGRRNRCWRDCAARGKLRNLSRRTSSSARPLTHLSQSPVSR